MQEKKLSFLTFILVLSFIAIIVLSFFIVKLYNNYNSLKTELDNKKNSSLILKSQVMNYQIIRLQMKKILHFQLLI